MTTNSNVFFMTKDGLYVFDGVKPPRLVEGPVDLADLWPVTKIEYRPYRPKGSRP